MAQNLTIAGATYQDVPSISVPKSGGGTASYVDTSDADATASDILKDKTAYVNGSLVTGTYEGGGGTDPFKSIFQSLVDRSITEVTAEMLDGVTSIGQSVFNYCQSLISIVVPDNIITITGSFSYNVNTRSLVIGNGCTTIGGDGCFRGNTQLRTVDIGTSIETIGTRAFYGCARLESFTCRATNPPTIEATTFTNTNPTFIIYVPAYSVTAYQTAAYWSDRASQIQAISS